MALVQNCDCIIFTGKYRGTSLITLLHPSTLQKVYVEGPMVGLGRVPVSYEQGNPVLCTLLYHINAR
jgi:hypothetical protein